ncbi:MAG: DUF4439 domain-containing protein [Microlunatus sp.]|nr:DUF4439 domain-containing protein [Microlunatus sp.]
MNENPAPPSRPRSMSRRALIILGGAAGLSVTGSLAGCSLAQQSSFDHQRSSSSAPPSPTPTPLPGAGDAGLQENDLAGFAAAALHRFGRNLTKGQRNLLTNLRDAHRDHAEVLARQDPLAITASTPPSPSAAPTASSVPPAPGRTVKRALAQLYALETAAATSYTRRALAPDGPKDQLGGVARLWGSLATAATCYADLCRAAKNPGPAVIGDQRANARIPDQATALRDLLEQCYAIIFGYQAAIAELPDGQAARAIAGLAGYRDLRDQLIDRLGAGKQQLPAASAAYRLPVQPTNLTRAATLINLMEVRMLPYLGLWLATAGRDRTSALHTMITTARDALSWSPVIIVWPGYPTS